MAVTYLSLLVLLPVAAVFSDAFAGGPGAFWRTITNPEGVSALELTFECALGVAAFNSVAGLVVAWVLVRDDFPGKRVVSSIIDLPFALPTIVAGLTLLSLYGPGSPFGIDVADTQIGIVCALAFVTLPFCVRSVQPVLAELDRETEEAAASLGASPAAVFRRVVLPGLAPAMLSGAGLAFARAVGEFGSVVLISGNLPFKTQVASSWVYSLSQSYDLPAAAAVSTVLILSALAVLGSISVVRHRFDVQDPP
jgi:sulfate/thiosulfate transport system permease protein